MVIGIIGGGASGMAAALAAAEQENVQVILFERHDRLGRKLMATGNGRCNLTNLDACSDFYYGNDLNFTQSALERFSVENTLQWFRRLGLITVAEDSGRVYPYSNQANSVVDVLRFALQKPNIQILTGFEVTKLKRTDSGFVVESGSETVYCDKVIVAAGGLAGTKLGGSMFGYKLLQKMGHRCTKLRPTLVQLRSDWKGCASLKGIRANCWAQITCDGILHNAGKGEIQFTEYGLSGPLIFEISRDVCQKPGQWICQIDFLPDMEAEELFALVQQRKKWQLSADELLTGILHNRLGRMIIKNVGITSNCPIRVLDEEELREVCRQVKEFQIHLTEPMGMDCAQVTAGGIVTEEFDPRTMESNIVPGLYACGEVLDVDGDCGGFNLQWAWSSGRLAGLSAGKESV